MTESIDFSRIASLKCLCVIFLIIGYSIAINLAESCDSSGVHGSARPCEIALNWLKSSREESCECNTELRMSLQCGVADKRARWFGHCIFGSTTSQGREVVVVPFHKAMVQLDFNWALLLVKHTNRSSEKDDKNAPAGGRTCL